ncbi:UNVERIFIED_CONTAM: hypothetical protein K2H54_049113 [Gekko kuhli]
MVFPSSVIGKKISFLVHYRPQLLLSLLFCFVLHCHNEFYHPKKVYRETFCQLLHFLGVFHELFFFMLYFPPLYWKYFCAKTFSYPEILGGDVSKLRIYWSGGMTAKGLQD